jgi:hypothetical protein
MPHFALDILRYLALVVLAACIGRVAFAPSDTPADLPGESGETLRRAFAGRRHR